MSYCAGSFSVTCGRNEIPHAPENFSRPRKIQLRHAGIDQKSDFEFGVGHQMLRRLGLGPPDVSGGLSLVLSNQQDGTYDKIIYIYANVETHRLSFL